MISEYERKNHIHPTLAQAFVEQYGSTSDAERAFNLQFLMHTKGLDSNQTLHLADFITHIQANSVESKFKPSIFAPPQVRKSVAPSELRKSKKKNSNNKKKKSVSIL